MFANTSKMIAAAVVVAAFLVPSTQAAGTAELSSAQISRLGAQTEAKGYIALNRYLVTRFGTGGLAPADVSRLGALTEARGYRAINTYLAQQAAGVPAAATATGFAWRDAFIGAAVAAGLFLLGGAAALVLRRRHSLA